MSMIDHTTGAPLTYAQARAQTIRERTAVPVVRETEEEFEDDFVEYERTAYNFSIPEAIPGMEYLSFKWTRVSPVCSLLLFLIYIYLFI